MALVPESVGAFQEIVALPWPATAVTSRGARGGVPEPASRNNNKFGEPVPILESLFELVDASRTLLTTEAVWVRSLPQIAATAPATCGAAIEVPLIVLVPPFFHVEVIEAPGANKSTHVPVFEKVARVSDDVDAPTVIAFGTRAGE